MTGENFTLQFISSYWTERTGR